MCESTISLVTDAALIDPFIKLSDNVIATDLNMFKYRQVMPGITLYSLIDLHRINHYPMIIESITTLLTTTAGTWMAACCWGSRVAL